MADAVAPQKHALVALISLEGCVRNACLDGSIPTVKRRIVDPKVVAIHREVALVSPLVSADATVVGVDLLVPHLLVDASPLPLPS